MVRFNTVFMFFEYVRVVGITADSSKDTCKNSALSESESIMTSISIRDVVDGFERTPFIFCHIPHNRECGIVC